MYKSDKIKIACISDSPKITTGFGNVAKQIYDGFLESGKFDVHVIALLDSKPYENEEDNPYMGFWPATDLDPMAVDTITHFMNSIRPDIVFIMSDPGSIGMYLHKLGYIKEILNDRLPPIVAYSPIEGTPINEVALAVFNVIELYGGTNVFWAKKSLDNVLEQMNLEHKHYVEFGSDHANFRKLSDADRTFARKMIGWDDSFVIGSVGTNKRTKGFTQLIYTAHELKKLMPDSNVKFYFHTDPDFPVMNGYNLRSLVNVYGVEDMIMFKPMSNKSLTGSQYVGVKRDKRSVEEISNEERNVILRSLKEAKNSQTKRDEMFMSLDYITIMNSLDLYLDLSEVEGWGLPVMEAMACGVPTAMVLDGDVREELFKKGVYPIDPLKKSLWTTWHTGARLVNIDPEEVAKTIIELRENHTLLKQLPELGMKQAGQYKWENTKINLTKIVEDTYVRNQRTTN